MNKIRVVNNEIIPFNNSDVIIDNNTITFLKNGDYTIDYIDSDNIKLTININDNVLIKLLEYSENKSLNINVTYNIEEKANLLLSKFYYNNFTNEVININLNKYKADIKYNFASISLDSNRHEINIRHLANNTTSYISNRTIALKDSSNVFDINSYVENGIKDCYINQQTKIITLDNSNNRINPNMFIGENSTTALHSSVVGTINNDDLFYLMTRGIEYKTAVKLIVKGIIFSNIITDMEKRERILYILEKQGGE